MVLKKQNEIVKTIASFFYKNRPFRNPPNLFWILAFKMVITHMEMTSYVEKVR